MKIIYLFLNLFFLNSFCEDIDFITLSSPKKQWSRFFSVILQKYPLDIFVESGTYLGETSLKASEYFSKIYTVEVSKEYYKQASLAFQGKNNIELFLGDTAEIFPKLLSKIQNERVLFWLDGHFMSSMIGSEDYVLEEYGYTPIIKELDVITASQLSENIILIDDIRLFRISLNNQEVLHSGNLFYPSLNEIVELLEKSNYEIVIFGDILLAYPKSTNIYFSSVVEACTKSRLFDGINYSDDIIMQAEQVIAAAAGEEQKSLIELYEEYSKPWKNWRNKSPHYNLWYALILHNQKKYQSACEQLYEVIALGYAHWRIYWYLAQNHEFLGEYQQAREALSHLFLQKKDYLPAINLANKVGFDFSIKKDLLRC